MFAKREDALRQLDAIGEGIVLFGENSFDSGKGEDYENIGWLADYSAGKNITLIGERNKRIIILRNGKIIPAQFSSNAGGGIDFEDYDKMHDVSYKRDRKVNALSRICADGNKRYFGNGKTDLLLISNGDNDWKDRIQELASIHKPYMNADGFIIMSNQHLGDNFIYSLNRKKLVGEKKQVKIGSEEYHFTAADF